MRRKLLLPLAVIVLLATAAIAAVTLLNYRSSKGSREHVLSTEISIGNRVAVAVYRNGKLIQRVEKVGDPWLLNFYAIIADVFLGRYYVDGVKFYDVSGAAHTRPDFEYEGLNPTLAVGVGGSDIEVSPLDYELGLLYARVDVPSANVAVEDNGTMITITFSGSWTADQNVTLKEVGLYWKGSGDYGSTTAVYVLIARDLLPSPLSVVESDSVIVSYTVYIPYDKPPILKNLVALIANYVFGLKAYNKAISYVATDGTVTTVMDLGRDEKYSPYDAVKEYTYLEVGSGLAIYRSTLNKLYEKVKRSPNYVKIELSHNMTHVVFSLPAGAITFTAETTITEVGIVISATDINSGEGSASKDVLILYFPLEQPIKVPAGSGIKFTFQLAFRLAPVSP